MEDGHLAAGWEPLAQLGVGDTVVRRQVYNLAERYRFTGERTGAPFHADDDLVAVQLSHGTPWGNDAMLLHPIGPGDREAVAERLRGVAPEPSHVWSATPTPDLSEHGFTLMGRPPAMVRAPGGAAPSLPEGLTVIEADTEELLAVYDRTGIHGFPINAPDGSPLESLLDPRLVGGPWRFFVGYAGDSPAAVASVFVACGVAQVEYVATLPTHRRRGYGEAVTWAATLAHPDVPAVLLASDDGRPVYERMGYLPMQRFTLWYWPGAR